MLNLMGMGLCYFTRRALTKSAVVAAGLAQQLDASQDDPFDQPLVNYVLIVGAMSLALNCAVWGLMTVSAAFGRNTAAGILRQLVPVWLGI